MWSSHEGQESFAIFLLWGLIQREVGRRTWGCTKTATAQTWWDFISTKRPRTLQANPPRNGEQLAATLNFPMSLSNEFASAPVSGRACIEVLSMWSRVGQYDNSVGSASLKW